MQKTEGIDEVLYIHDARFLGQRKFWKSSQETIVPTSQLHLIQKPSNSKTKQGKKKCDLKGLGIFGSYQN